MGTWVGLRSFAHTPVTLSNKKLTERIWLLAGFSHLLTIFCHLLVFGISGIGHAEAALTKCIAGCMDG